MTENGSKPELAPLPVDSYREAAPHLRRPFAAAAIHFKVQSTLSGNRGLIVPYIDVRLVYERLNLVCPDLWEIDVQPLGDRIDSGVYVCNMEIGGIKRPNVGEAGPAGPKAGYSDSIKRAAVAFGVGVSLYAVPKQILASQTGNEGLLTQRKKDQKVSLFITDKGERYLRGMYAGWLEDYGIPAYGQALDHGDVEGSIGDPEEALTEGEPAQDDLLLASERAEAEKLYEEVTQADAQKRRKLAPGRFKAQLEGAETPEKIAELVERVKNL